MKTRQLRSAALSLFLSTEVLTLHFSLFFLNLSLTFSSTQCDLKSVRLHSLTSKSSLLKSLGTLKYHRDGIQAVCFLNESRGQNRIQKSEVNEEKKRETNADGSLELGMKGLQFNNAEPEGNQDDRSARRKFANEGESESESEGEGQEDVSNESSEESCEESRIDSSEASNFLAVGSKDGRISIWQLDF